VLKVKIGHFFLKGLGVGDLRRVRAGNESHAYLFIAKLRDTIAFASWANFGTILSTSGYHG